LGKFQPTHGVGFPKIDAWTEPIVVVIAGFEGVTIEQSLADGQVAPMIREYEACGEPVHG
jgi:hypothetical protein